jgi:hypothetical protein
MRQSAARVVVGVRSALGRNARAVIARWIGVACVVHLGACGQAIIETDPKSVRHTAQQAISAAHYVGGESTNAFSAQAVTLSSASETGTDAPVYTATEVLTALKFASGRSTGITARYFDIDQDGAATLRDAQLVLQYAIKRAPPAGELEHPQAQTDLVCFVLSKHEKPGLAAVAACRLQFPIDQCMGCG